MSYVLGLKCKECGHRTAVSPVHVCEQCFGPYEVEYDYAKMKGKVTRESIARGPKSLWRYKDLLPVATETGEAGSAVVNDAALTQRVVEILKKKLGENNVLAKKPVMGSEDFSEYGRTAEKDPIFLFWLGAVSEEKWREAERSGKALPSLHSPFFAPDADRTIKTGVEATVTACMELLGRR